MSDSGFDADAATRRLVLVSGDQARSEAWVVGQLTAEELGAGLWVAETAPAGVRPTPAGRVSQALGAEYRLLVFNAHQGLHPDAFAAAVGTLRGGGDCVVLAPALDAWPAFADPDKIRFACYPRSLGDMRGLFLERLVRLWRHDAAVFPVNPDDSAVALRVAGPPASAFRMTAEQQDAVAAIERVAHGHARRPLVLTADRGRGKSTVLGVAAARLLQGGLARVTVVAPGRAAVATLFRHALATLGRDGHAVADIEIGNRMLRFRLPSECMTTPEGLGLVLVDEAAAIPVPVLNRLLAQSNRLVFSSTVHGYEGSGRGFDLRFSSLLQQAMPQWHSLRLSAPVRWPEHDPLEALLNASFLLDAELNDIDTDESPVVERIEPSALVADERLLRSTFGLLINAHYQTRPSDLRQLLDNPDVRLWLARTGETVVGVLLASAEGGFDEAMVRRVLSGERRPRGHLLPQSLAVHAGLDPALWLSTLRVQRIAVHPELRRRGIGHRLLGVVAAWATHRQFDLLGCAYGVDLPLLAFWQVAGFVPVRLGVRVDPASAAHSLFMLRGLSQAGRDLALAGQQGFQAALPWSLAASLRDLDSRLAVVLLNARDCADIAPSPADRRALERIVAGTRQPATADATIWKALVARAAASESPERLAALIAWRVQGRPLEEVCRTFAIAGRKALEAQLQALLCD